MKKIGGYIAIFGVLAIALPYFNLQLRFLGWIENWGETVAWAIKLGIIVVGLALFLMGKKDEENTTEPNNN